MTIADSSTGEEKTDNEEQGEQEWTIMTSSSRLCFGSNRTTSRRSRRSRRNKKKHHVYNDNGNDELEMQTALPNTQENEKMQKEKTCQAINSCMEALWCSRRLFITPLLRACLLHTSERDNHNDNNYVEGNTVVRIVCYGIGHFASPSTANMKRGRYRANAPMVQLACILLIRRCLSCKYLHKIIQEEELSMDSKMEMSSLLPSDYEVEMWYYDPCTTPVEQSILEDCYNVRILSEGNDWGKRCCIPLDPTNAGTRTTTLFYMPHCPMRLYSNVLWGHFSPHTLSNGKVVLVGNCLSAYVENRAFLSFHNHKQKQEEEQETNCIFVLEKFLRETAVSWGGNHQKKKKKSKRYGSVDDCHDEILGGVQEAAFNDLCVSSFGTPSNVNTSENINNNEMDSIIGDPLLAWPPRPPEHIVSEDQKEAGELRP